MVRGCEGVRGGGAGPASSVRVGGSGTVGPQLPQDIYRNKIQSQLLDSAGAVSDQTLAEINHTFSRNKKLS